MTTAIILPPSEAGYLRVAGLPLVQRTALAALRAGCDSVVALGGDDPDRLRRVFRSHWRTRGLEVVDCVGANKLAAERIVVLPSDWHLPPETLQRVCDTEVDGRPILLYAGDGGGGITLRRGPIANPEELEAAVDDDATLRVSLDGDTARPVANREQAAAVEEQMVRTLREATADTDGPIARFDRAISTRLSRLLVYTPLRPNHITTIGTAIGLFGARAFSTGTYTGGLLGAFLFWCAVIIDGCDGEVARLKFLETKYGGLYDVVTDNIVHAAVFIGLGVGHFRFAPGANVPLFVGALLGGFLCALAATYFCLLRHPPVKHLQPKSRRGKIRQSVLRGFEAVMNRDFAYLLIPLAAAARLGWFLWGSVFGTYAYAAGLVWIYHWRDAE